MAEAAGQGTTGGRNGHGRVVGDRARSTDVRGSRSTRESTWRDRNDHLACIQIRCLQFPRSETVTCVLGRRRDLSPLPGTVTRAAAAGPRALDFPRAVSFLQRTLYPDGHPRREGFHRMRSRSAAAAAARAEYRRAWTAGLPRRAATRLVLVGAAFAAVTWLLSWRAGILAALRVAAADTVQQWRRHSSATAWRKGARGEVRTARILRRLSRRGYTVLHDRCHSWKPREYRSSRRRRVRGLGRGLESLASPYAYFREARSDLP